MKRQRMQAKVLFFNNSVNRKSGKFYYFHIAKTKRNLYTACMVQKQKETHQTFSTKAGVYNRGRPEWPDFIYQRLLEKCGIDPNDSTACRNLIAVDIGAGTGKTTFPLAQLGCTVIAVEPNEKMRAELRRRCAEEGISNIVVTGGDAFDPQIPEEYKGRVRLIYSGNSAHWWSSRMPGSPTDQERRAVRAWQNFAHPGATVGILYLRSAENSQDVLDLHALITDAFPHTRGAPTELGSTRLFEASAFRAYFNDKAAPPEAYYTEIPFCLEDFEHMKQWLGSLSYFPDNAFEDPAIEARFHKFFDALALKGSGVVNIPFGLRLYTGTLYRDPELGSGNTLNLSPSPQLC